VANDVQNLLVDFAILTKNSPKRDNGTGIPVNQVLAAIQRLSFKK
jgi:hypothetical protein